MAAISAAQKPASVGARSTASSTGRQNAAPAKSSAADAKAFSGRLEAQASSGKPTGAPTDKSPKPSTYGPKEIMADGAKERSAIDQSIQQKKDALPKDAALQRDLLDVRGMWDKSVSYVGDIAQIATTPSALPGKH